MAAGGPTTRLVGADEGVGPDAGGETGGVLEAPDIAGRLCRHEKRQSGVSFVSLLPIRTKPVLRAPRYKAESTSRQHVLMRVAADTATVAD